MKSAIFVDEYIKKHQKWEEGLALLIEIARSRKLTETIKWGAPTYTYENKNVIGLGAFKSHFGIWFFQGALLKDDKKKLSNAQEGKTKAMRQWRFNKVKEIDPKLVSAYIDEAISNARDGLEIKPAKNKPLEIPPELEKALQNNPSAMGKFELMSLSNKREFAEYVIEAKKTETKSKRINKIIPMIIDGRGLNDKYR